MSQKNETPALLLSLLITAGLAGVGGWWFWNRVKAPTTAAGGNSTVVSNSQITQQISTGDQILVSGSTNPNKQRGSEALAKKDFATAVKALQASLRVDRNDPEALIALNNAQIGNATSYTLAVSVPIGSDPNGSLEILRGVAQAQREVNQTGGIKGIPLRVAIANDDNNPDQAQQIAAALVKDKSVLGVIGPYASDVSLATAPIYKDGELVAISPISTSVKLSGFSPYFFRTVPSDYVSARALADYMLNRLQKKTAIVFFNSQSGYSQSLKSEFVTALALGGGQALMEVDLSDPGFSPSTSLKTAQQQGVEAIVLVTNTGTLDKALQVVQVNRQRLPILGGDDVYAPKTLEIGGPEAVGMVVAVPWHIDANPTAAFPRNSRALWGGDVNWRTALSYDAIQALVAALKRDPTRRGVQQALQNPNFSATGASGAIRFLPSGDRNAPVQLVKVTPGQRSGKGYDFVPISR